MTRFPCEFRSQWSWVHRRPNDRRARPTTRYPRSVTTNADAASAISYWLVASPAGPRRPPLRGPERADVAIVGAGFTGLWTALALTDTDPSLRVAVLEQETVGFGASGRNGGFCQASLTHGLDNGLRHFPDEIDVLEREGIANLRELIAFTRDHGIDCDLEETGGLAVADQPHQVDEFRAAVDESAAHGEELVFLDRDAIQAEVHSPLWLAGLYQPPGRDVILDPAKLVRGLARVCEERGITIHEDTRVRAVDRRAGGVRLTTEAGATLDADHVVVATSAYSGWLRRLESHFVPVYDYVLVSEPLTPDAADIDRLGAAPGHVRREQPVPLLPADRRRPDPVGRLRRDLLPQQRRRAAVRPAAGDVRQARGPLPAGVPTAGGPALPVSLGRRDRHDVAVHGHVRPGARRPPHLRARATRVWAWARAAGPAASSATSSSDRSPTCCGFGSSVASPFPFPPEPLRSIAVNVVRHELDRADRNEGRRGLILKTLDAFGIGFDS